MYKVYEKGHKADKKVKDTICVQIKSVNNFKKEKPKVTNLWYFICFDLVIYNSVGLHIE